MTAVWIGLWWVSLAVAVGAGWALRTVVSRSADQSQPLSAPDYRVPAGEACRGEWLPSEADMLRLITGRDQDGPQ